MGAREIRRGQPVQGGLWLCRQPGRGQPGGDPLPAQGPSVRHLADLHAPGVHAAAVADAQGHGRTRRACAVRRQPLRAQRYGADHGERGGRPRRLRAPCARGLGLQDHRRRGLVWRWLAGLVLPVAGREAVRHAYAGGRPVQHHAGRAAAGRRLHLPGCPCVARGGAGRLDRPQRAGRKRSRPPRPGAGSVPPGQQAAVFGRVSAAFSRRADWRASAAAPPGCASCWSACASRVGWRWNAAS